MLQAGSLVQELLSQLPIDVPHIRALQLLEVTFEINIVEVIRLEDVLDERVPDVVVHREWFEVSLVYLCD